MNHITQQPFRLAKRVQVLLSTILALFVLGACDSLTQAPTTDEPKPALVGEPTPGASVELAPAATPDLYHIPSFQGTSVQFRVNQNYVDRNGYHKVDATWWGQNRGKPNLSILQFKTARDTRWHTAGGDPRLENGYIRATYGIYPYRNAGPHGFNSYFHPSQESTTWYWRICTVGNYTNMPLTCGRIVYFIF